MNAVEKIIARPITARKITGATLQSLPYSFPDDLVVGVDQRFTTPLLGLPKQLQQLGFTYTRNSPKTVYQNGSLVTLAANQFGTTYDAVTGLYAYEAEPAATNLLLRSEDFSSASWTKGGATVTADAIASPSLALTADKLVEDATTGLHRAFQAVTLTAAVHTLSFLAKAAERSWCILGNSSDSFYSYFDLQNGVVGSVSGSGVTSSIRSVGNGWFRCAMTFTAASAAAKTMLISTTTGNGVINPVGSTGSGIYIWGAQLETGSRATSYIATAGATASRAADVLSDPTANLPGFNAAGYTLVVDGRCDVDLTTLRSIISVNDGGTNNRSSIFASTVGMVQTITASGGVIQATANEVALSASRFKAAYSNAANTFLRAVNGVAGTADVSGSMPVTPTTLNIGHQTGSAQFNGYIYGFKLIPVALNQAQTTAQTS